MNRIHTLPTLTVALDNAPLSATDINALVAVRVAQKLSVPALCELTFQEPPGIPAAIARLTTGTKLQVTVAGQRTPLFTGQVTALEHTYSPSGGRTVRVRGYDLLHRLRKRQPVRAHVQVTLRDLAQELVADIGAVVEAAEPTPLWPRLFQHGQSDLELLAEAAERGGLYLTLREDVLHLASLAGLDEPLPLALGDTLLEARIEVNGDPACRSVTVAGWDMLRVQPRAGSAVQDRVGRDVAAEAPPDRLGSMGERVLVNEFVADDRHADGLAQAELDRRRAHEVTLWGVAEGDPRLRPLAKVDVQGVAEALAGTYVLTSVTHIIDAQVGYVSEIATAPPVPSPRVVGTTVLPGVVTQVADPDGLGRVKVSLPTVGNLETEWMFVLISGAGKGKGLVALPDVGDQVLVLCASADPSQGVVLGGVYGMDGAPDSGVEDRAVRRFTFLTPGGQRIRLDDAQQQVRIEDASGSFVEFTPAKARLHAAADLEIDAPGKAIVIRGQTVDFERA